MNLEIQHHLVVATTSQAWVILQADRLAPKFWAAGSSSGVVSSK